MLVLVLPLIFSIACPGRADTAVQSINLGHAIALDLNSPLLTLEWDLPTRGAFSDLDLDTFGDALHLIYKSERIVQESGITPKSYLRLAQILSQMGHPVRAMSSPQLVPSEIQSDRNLSPATKAALENSNLTTYAKLREVTAVYLRHEFGFPFARIEEISHALRVHGIRMYADAIERAHRQRKSLPASTSFKELAISSALRSTLNGVGLECIRDLRPDVRERLKKSATPELLRQYEVLHASIRDAVGCGNNLWF